MERVYILKTKGSIFNIPIEARSICNILSMTAVSNRLILVKLKEDLKCRGHVYFEQVGPHITYLKSHNKLHKDISIAKGLLKTCVSFFALLKFHGETESVTEKNISDGKEISEKIHYTRNETKYASAEDPLNM